MVDGKWEPAGNISVEQAKQESQGRSTGCLYGMNI